MANTIGYTISRNDSASDATSFVNGFILNEATMESSFDVNILENGTQNKRKEVFTFIQNRTGVKRTLSFNQSPAMARIYTYTIIADVGGENVDLSSCEVKFVNVADPSDVHYQTFSGNECVLSLPYEANFNVSMEPFGFAEISCNSGCDINFKNKDFVDFGGKKYVTEANTYNIIKNNIIKASGDDIVSAGNTAFWVISSIEEELNDDSNANINVQLPTWLSKYDIDFETNTITFFCEENVSSARRTGKIKVGYNNDNYAPSNYFITCSQPGADNSPIPEEDRIYTDLFIVNNEFDLKPDGTVEVSGETYDTISAHYTVTYGGHYHKEGSSKIYTNSNLLVINNATVTNESSCKYQFNSDDIILTYNGGDYKKATFINEGVDKLHVLTSWFDDSDGAFFWKTIGDTAKSEPRFSNFSDSEYAKGHMLFGNSNEDSVSFNQAKQKLKQYTITNYLEEQVAVFIYQDSISIDNLLSVNGEVSIGGRNGFYIEKGNSLTIKDEDILWGGDSKKIIYVDVSGSTINADVSLSKVSPSEASFTLAEDKNNFTQSFEYNSFSQTVSYKCEPIELGDEKMIEKEDEFVEGVKVRITCIENQEIWPYSTGYNMVSGQEDGIFYKEFDCDTGKFDIVYNRSDEYVLDRQTIFNIIVTPIASNEPISATELIIEPIPEIVVYYNLVNNTSSAIAHFELMMKDENGKEVQPHSLPFKSSWIVNHTLSQSTVYVSFTSNDSSSLSAIFDPNLFNGHFGKYESLFDDFSFVFTPDKLEDYDFDVVCNELECTEKLITKGKRYKFEYDSTLGVKSDWSFSGAKFMQFTYTWTEDDGRDLDTITKIVNIGDTCFERGVGYANGSSMPNGSGSFNGVINANNGIDEKVIVFAGDNTGYGHEYTIIDFDSLKTYIRRTGININPIKIWLNTRWFSTRSAGNFSFDAEAFNAKSYIVGNKEFSYEERTQNISETSLRSNSITSRENSPGAAVFENYDHVFEVDYNWKTDNVSVKAINNETPIITAIRLKFEQKNNEVQISIVYPIGMTSFSDLNGCVVAIKTIGGLHNNQRINVWETQVIQLDEGEKYIGYSMVIQPKNRTYQVIIENVLSFNTKECEIEFYNQRRRSEIIDGSFKNFIDFNVRIYEFVNGEKVYISDFPRDRQKFYAYINDNPANRAATKQITWSGEETTFSFDISEWSLIAKPNSLKVYNMDLWSYVANDTQYKLMNKNKEMIIL